MKDDQSEGEVYLVDVILTGVNLTKYSHFENAEILSSFFPCALYYIKSTATQANWLILPVIIFFDQRLSHACLRLNKFLVHLRMAHYMNHYLPEHHLTTG